MTTKRIFASNILFLRERQNKSGADVARELGISRSRYYIWERAKSIPGSELLIELSDLYGVTIDDLLKKVLINED